MDYIGLEDLPDCFYPIILVEPIMCYHTKKISSTRILYNEDMNPLLDELATIIRVIEDE